MDATDRTLSGLAQKVEAIQKSLVREQCWVCWMTPNDDAPPMTQSKEEMRLIHHDYLLELERRGMLFAAGPFVDDKGHRHGAGMLIIRARNRADAEDIAFAEPYTKAGQRIMTLTPWEPRASFEPASDAFLTFWGVEAFALFMGNLVVSVLDKLLSAFVALVAVASLAPAVRARFPLADRLSPLD